MRLVRVILAQAVTATMLVVVGASALAALGTAVDGGGGLAASTALHIGILRVPGLLLPLLPVLCGLAAGVAAARQLARGERRALALAGVPPRRIAALGLGVGLVVGGLGWGLHGSLVPVAEARADELGGLSGAPWVFLGGRVVRVSDGAVVQIEGDAIVGVEGLAEQGRSAPALRRAAARQRPGRASAATLAEAPGVPARVERLGRMARVIAAALLAFLGWLPLARLPATQVGVALGAGLTWASVDVVLRAAAAQGRVGPSVGAWGAALVVLVLVALALGWVRRTRAPGGAPWRTRGRRVSAP